MDQFSICFRDLKDPDYREKLSALTQSFRQQTVLPFLGAGLSRDLPSGLPMAKELCAKLIDLLWASVQPAKEQADLCTSDEDFAWSILKEARLERLLDALQQVYGQNALEYLQPLNSTKWNENHASLAGLCREGMLRQCVTLNFDMLIEYAAEAHGVAFETICPLANRYQHTKKYATRSISVIKPHGSFEMFLSLDSQLSALRTTISQLGTEAHPLNEEVLRRAFAGHTTLFVAGYSDDDWDIFPIIAKEARKFRQIVWVQYAELQQVRKKIEPSGPDLWSLHHRIKPMLQSCGAQAVLIYAILKDLCTDIRKGLGITIETPPPNRQYLHPKVSIFSDKIKNAVATAILLQHTGKVSLSLLNWLAKHERIKREPNLQWQVQT